jgi:hypothetical protein
MKTFTQADFSIHENEAAGRECQCNKKAPKERDKSTIPRGSETLHPVKPNLRFIIGVKGAGMRGCANLTHREKEVNTTRTWSQL